MPRIGDPRTPARPSGSDQQARRSAILTAAARLGRRRALDRIAAQQIAAEAGVALRTLYRYYPSKHHVFAAVLTAQIERLPPPRPRPADPPAAVAEFMSTACSAMLRHRHLAHAMITATQIVRAQTGGSGEHTVRNLILATAGVDAPTAEQVRIARLVEQLTFGVLTWTVGGELDPAQAVADVRLASLRLVGDAFGPRPATANTPPRVGGPPPPPSLRSPGG